MHYVAGPEIACDFPMCGLKAIQGTPGAAEYDVWVMADGFAYSFCPGHKKAIDSTARTYHEAVEKASRLRTERNPFRFRPVESGVQLELPLEYSASDLFLG